MPVSVRINHEERITGEEGNSVGLGVRLPEIAQVLRQRDLATTAVYAKIDHRALRELALPWPETVR